MTKMTFAIGVLVMMVSTMTAEAQVYIRPVSYSESYSVTQQPLYVTTTEGYSAPTTTYAQQPIVMQQPVMVQQPTVMQPTMLQPTMVQPTVVQQPVMMQQPTGATYYAGGVCAQPVAYYRSCGCVAQPCCMAQPCVPQAAYQPVAACETPVVAGCQPYYVRRGLLGQPKLYVPGQPIRNVLRALVP